MGLIKAAIGSVGGVLADQWKEYIYCDAIPAHILAVKGQKRTSRRSSNTRGSENIISNGSVIAVAEGQCMMIVEQGKVVDLCADPGEYTYDAATEPSIFCGDLGDSIRDVFDNIGKRFAFGGEAPMDQRVYYFNTKEIIGNKYGTTSPVPFRVVDERAGIDIDISVRCFGEYSYKLVNPMLFYTNVCGNVEAGYDRASLDSQLKSELLTALQPAFARISALGVRYSAIPGHTLELSEILKEELSQKWRDRRGIEIQTIGVSSIKASEEDEQMIKDLQRNAAFMDPTRAAAHMVGAQASAMQAAAANKAGAMTGFMGMNMAAQAGGLQAGDLFAMGQAQKAQQNAPGWQCACGETVSGNFCPQCGAKKPEENSWKCVCGTVTSGNFCPACGAKKPASGWTCACGSVNQGKFCSQCGAKKPAGAPLYRCDKCGWQPADPKNPPKFCPECGDRFDENDAQ